MSNSSPCIKSSSIRTAAASPAAPASRRRRETPARGKRASWRWMFRTRQAEARRPRACRHRLRRRRASSRGRGIRRGSAPGREQASDQRDIQQQFQERGDSSISARCRPEYSSTMASCTMVSSRCVAGLSTGMRAFSAIATMIKAIKPSPSDTRKPDFRRDHKRGHGRQLRRARDQRERKDDHQHRRLGQRGDHHFAARSDAAEDVPTSSPASARKNRALPSSAMMAIRSADQENSRPLRNVGISDAATQVPANTM